MLLFLIFKVFYSLAEFLSRTVRPITTRYNVSLLQMYCLMLLSDKSNMHVRNFFYLQ